MKKILATGGTGYIGSHTAIELIKNGYEVELLDNLFNSKITVLDQIEKITGVRPKFYEADILDKDALDKIFAEGHYDAVIHFAGLKAVGESVEKLDGSDEKIWRQRARLFLFRDRLWHPRYARVCRDDADWRSDC